MHLTHQIGQCAGNSCTVGVMKPELPVVPRTRLLQCVVLFRDASFSGSNQRSFHTFMNKAMITRELKSELYGTLWPLIRDTRI